MTRDASKALAYAIAIMSGRLDVEAPANAAIIRGYIDLLAALRSRPAPPDDLALRHAWEAGFRLCRSYGDNHHHFDGEQKERRWRDYANGLAAPAPVAAPAPETPDVVEGQCQRCGERDGTHADDCRLWTCDHCGHDRAAHRDGVASRLERDGHFHPCRAAQAHGYLSRVFVHHAPQCMPMPDLMGVCTQIDNLLTGMLAPGIAVERCDYVYADGWTCERAKGHPSVHVLSFRMANPPAPETPAPVDVPACPDGQHSYRRNAPPQNGDVCFVCRKSIWWETPAPDAMPEDAPCPLCGGGIDDGACLTCRISDVALTSRPWGTGCHHCDDQPPDQWCWWCGRRGTGRRQEAQP